MQERVDGSPTDTASLYSEQLIRYTRLHTLPDLIIFMHNLLSELRSTVGIANYPPHSSELTVEDGIACFEFYFLSFPITSGSSSSKEESTTWHHPTNPPSSMRIQ